MFGCNVLDKRRAYEGTCDKARKIEAKINVQPWIDICGRVCCEISTVWPKQCVVPWSVQGISAQSISSSSSSSSLISSTSTSNALFLSNLSFPLTTGVIPGEEIISLAPNPGRRGVGVIMPSRRLTDEGFFFQCRGSRPSLAVLLHLLRLRR